MKWKIERLSNRLLRKIHTHLWSFARFARETLNTDNFTLRKKVTYLWSFASLAEYERSLFPPTKSLNKSGSSFSFIIIVFSTVLRKKRNKSCDEEQTSVVLSLFVSSRPFITFSFTHLLLAPHQLFLRNALFAYRYTLKKRKSKICYG